MPWLWFYAQSIAGSSLSSAIVRCSRSRHLGGPARRILSDDRPVAGPDGFDVFRHADVVSLL